MAKNSQVRSTFELSKDYTHRIRGAIGMITSVIPLAEQLEGPRAADYWRQVAGELRSYVEHFEPTEIVVQDRLCGTCGGELRAGEHAIVVSTNMGRWLVHEQCP